MSKSSQEEISRKERRKERKKKFKRKKYIIKSKLIFTNNRMFVTGEGK